MCGVGDAGGVGRQSGAGGALGDEISGAALPADLVRAARTEEVSFMEEWRCWERVSWEDAVRCGGRKPIRARWVDVDKGGPEAHQFRSRWVARQFKDAQNDDYFSPTPP